MAIYFLICLACLFGFNGSTNFVLQFISADILAYKYRASKSHMKLNRFTVITNKERSINMRTFSILNFCLWTDFSVYLKLNSVDCIESKDETENQNQTNCE